MKPSQWDKFKQLARIARWRRFDIERPRNRRSPYVLYKGGRVWSFTTLDELEEFLAGPDRFEDGEIISGQERLAATAEEIERFQALCELASDKRCRLLRRGHSGEPWQIVTGWQPITVECWTLDDVERELQER